MRFDWRPMVRDKDDYLIANPSADITSSLGEARLGSIGASCPSVVKSNGFISMLFQPRYINL